MIIDDGSMVELMIDEAIYACIMHVYIMACICKCTRRKIL